MKNLALIYFTTSLAVIGLLSSCNDSFMDKYPETQITEKSYFKTASDLETYANSFYGYIGSNYWDVTSDNVLYVENSSVFSMMRGEITPENAGQWGWGNIRNVNFMLARANQAQGDQAVIRHYIGLARLMRAKLYYDKVKTYSDVPWYNHDLKTTETDELYKTQDSRALVVDSIMADLDYAVSNMKSLDSKTKMGQEVALALQARIALYEGTFRKYHQELGLNDYDRFLTTAVEACEKLMNTGKYSLSQVRVNGLGAYQSLFCNTDLTSNPEMIMVEDYDKGLGRMHNAQAIFDWTTGLSRDLMEDYLVVENGKTKTFQSVPGYDTITYKNIFKDRDPRLAQTFMAPGYHRITNPDKAYVQNLGAGGYPQVKFDPQSYDQISWGKSYTDLPIFRYAEILLIYAEAKAELGKLTQEDLDKSINLIRQRAGMPNAMLTDWLANIDPVQEKHYPNVTGAQKGAILEIRRERRIELACEGFRYGDLMRWSCGKLLEHAPEGMYIPGLGEYDLNGDNVPDIGIQTKAQPISTEDAQKYGLTVYTLDADDQTISLTDGNKGHIQLKSQIGKFHFEEPKYYYYPLDIKDISMNPNLKQNKYWE